MAAPDPAAGERLALASQRRGRAYRAQSALLLRHADPSAPAKPGGTLETVPAALARDLPVLFIDTVRGGGCRGMRGHRPAS